MHQLALVTYSFLQAKDLYDSLQLLQGDGGAATLTCI